MIAWSTCNRKIFVPTIEQMKSLFDKIIVALGTKGPDNQESGTSKC